MVSLHHTFNILKRHFSERTFYNTTVSICSYYILFEGYHFFSFTYLGHFSISQKELDTEKQRIKNQYREEDEDNIKGFAFVIGIYGPKGTKADVNLVSSTFEDDLKFAVDRRMDQTCEELACLIKAASAPKMKYPLSCKCIAFYFAGHGGSDESGICTNIVRTLLSHTSVQLYTLTVCIFLQLILSGDVESNPGPVG